MTWRTPLPIFEGCIRSRHRARYWRKGSSSHEKWSDTSDTEAEQNESDDAGLMTVQLCHNTRDPVQLLLEITRVIIRLSEDVFLQGQRCFRDDPIEEVSEHWRSEGSGLSGIYSYLESSTEICDVQIQRKSLREGPGRQRVHRRRSERTTDRSGE